MSERQRTRRSIGVRVLFAPSDTDPSPREAKVGLQDKKQEVHAGAPRSGGAFAFEATLDVSGDPDTGPPSFSGPFAHGTPASRFLYLSWKRPGGGKAPWAQRVKIPLGGITWKQVAAALKSGRSLEADVTGRKPHDSRPVVWK